MAVREGENAPSSSWRGFKYRADQTTIRPPVKFGRKSRDLEKQVGKMKNGVERQS